MNAIQRLFKSDEQEQQFISTLRDPFQKDSVDRIWMNISKNWKGKIQYSASVEFKNGPTSGEHKIEAEDFTTLVQKVESFLKQL